MFKAAKHYYIYLIRPYSLQQSFDHQIFVDLWKTGNYEPLSGILAVWLKSQPLVFWEDNKHLCIPNCIVGLQQPHSPPLVLLQLDIISICEQFGWLLSVLECFLWQPEHCREAGPSQATIWFPQQLDKRNILAYMSHWADWCERRHTCHFVWAN